MPRSAELLDLLADWAPNEIIREVILVHKPAWLYGFKGTTA